MHESGYMWKGFGWCARESSKRDWNNLFEIFLDVESSSLFMMHEKLYL